MAKLKKISEPASNLADRNLCSDGKPDRQDELHVQHGPPVQQLWQTLVERFDGRNELERQAQFARSIGSSFVAAVLEAGKRQLDYAPHTAALITHWRGNPASDAIAMRFNAALHAIARRGEVPMLSGLYSGEHQDFDGAIAQALCQCDEDIAKAMAYPTQTNEVGRAAALLCALMVAKQNFGMDFELLELGASCGLNLNLARYCYELAGKKTGNLASPVCLTPEWRGSDPTIVPISVASARGVDLNPLDPHDGAATERMFSYVWADQKERLARLALSLEVARKHEPRVDHGSAAAWLTERLAEPQKEGVCRTIFHSMALQYLGLQDQKTVIRAIREAGAQATISRPLAWISFEWTQSRSEVHLLLTCWPDGTMRHLATCHPYGAWIDWQDDSDR